MRTRDGIDGWRDTWSSGLDDAANSLLISLHDSEPGMAVQRLAAAAGDQASRPAASRVPAGSQPDPNREPVEYVAAACEALASAVQDEHHLRAVPALEAATQALDRMGRVPIATRPSIHARIESSRAALAARANANTGPRLPDQPGILSSSQAPLAREKHHSRSR